MPDNLVEISFLEMLELAIDDIGFAAVLIEMLKVSEPQSLDDATDMTFALCQALSKSVSWQGHLHILDHPETGMKCADGLAEGLPSIIAGLIQEDREELYRRTGIDYTSPNQVNEATYQQIIKEIDHE